MDWSNHKIGPDAGTGVAGRVTGATPKEGDAMTLTGDWRVEEGLLRVRTDFLDHPALVLTPSQAARRFGLDAEACSAILTALLNSGVLAKTQEGGYITFFPGCGSEVSAAECNTRA
jgi:hypothetical protein